MTCREYIVQEGEDLVAIAARFGFADTAALSEAPENASLLRERAGGAQLFPGDVVYVPARTQRFVQVRNDATTTFTLRRPKYEVRFVVRDVSGKARAGLPYRLSAGAHTLAEGVTDGEGTLRAEVPGLTRELDLSVGGIACQRLVIGGLNPMRGAPDGGASGVAQRLRSLGFDVGGPQGSRAGLGEAIMAFKRAYNLQDPEQTTLDEALFDAISRHYGQ